MTRQEHLLVILAEECAELAQRVSKALRFGTAEVQPGQDESNAERMTGEMADLLGVWRMLADAGLVPHADRIYQGAVAQGKRGRVERYLDLSRRCGTLDDRPRPDPDTPTESENPTPWR